jgi:hypothetical protein
MSVLGDYKYKGIALSDLIKGFNNSTTGITDITNGFNLDSSDIVASEVPFTGIDETLPNDIKYKYNGTDISNYAIVEYTKYVSTTSYFTVNVPSWCNKIRTVLCGGGGGGGAATANQAQTGSYHWHGTHWQYSLPYHYDHDGSYNHQGNNARAGAGGGGGGFLYHTMTVVPNSTFYGGVGKGGVAGANVPQGGDTYIQYGGSSYIGYGGLGANKTTAGAGRRGANGTYYAGVYGDNGDNISGAGTAQCKSGDGGDQPRNNSSNTVGKGGRGYPTNGFSYLGTTSSLTNNGADGEQGFAIIYFIKDD